MYVSEYRMYYRSNLSWTKLSRSVELVVRLLVSGFVDNFPASESNALKNEELLIVYYKQLDSCSENKC